MKLTSAILLGLLGVSCSLVLKKLRPELSLLIAAATGILLFSLCLPPLRELLSFFQNQAIAYGLETEYIGLGMKVIGIAYLAQMGASLCQDAGESAIAGKVELCGRIMILSTALPTAFHVMDTAMQLIERALP